MRGDEFETACLRRLGVFERPSRAACRLRRWGRRHLLDTLVAPWWRV